MGILRVAAQKKKAVGPYASVLMQGRSKRAPVAPRKKELVIFVLKKMDSFTGPKRFNIE